MKSDKIVEARDPFGSHGTDYIMWILGALVTFAVICVPLAALLGEGLGILVSVIAALALPRLLLVAICR